MLKAKGDRDGRPTLILGLSFANLREFFRHPMQTYIQVRAEEMGLQHDILIFSGETEAQMGELVAGSLTPDAVVHISDKLKQ